MRWPEDLSPFQASDFEFNTEYYTWFLENGKPFLVSVEAENKWREDPRCQQTNQYVLVLAVGHLRGIRWKTPPIHVSNNLWEQPPFSNVSEQPPLYGGMSSSQHAYTDDRGYIP
ncbi:hypothetical protein V6N11_004860 [Hibiscus sabdariffa]|uniref:Uncharacterized protein n=1 Tax=Hibiscus sabdariffa TaxID=183260 RepID=A0ABR2SHJ0_9ROSI